MKMIKVLLLPTFLFAGDLGEVFTFMNEVLTNLDQVLAQLILFAFVVATFVIVGVTYLIYFIFFRQSKGVDERLYQKVSVDEERLLKRVARYYLYTVGMTIIIFIVNFIVFDYIVNYISLMVPITLFFLLYRHLRDDHNLLLASLLVSILDFIIYASIVQFEIAFTELNLLKKFTKIDLFLVIEYLPLFLLLLFFVRNAYTPRYKLVYQFLMVPLFLSVLATAVEDYLLINFYLYDIVFVSFCLVAYNETRQRILRDTGI